MSSTDIPRTYETEPGETIQLSDQPGTWTEISVSASPADLWPLISDINISARFTEEFQGAEWKSEAPAEGAVFVGRNKHRAVGEWEVPCHITSYVVDESFGWAVVDPVESSARWRFDLHPEGDDSTRLRYTVTLGPGPSGLTPAIERMPDRTNEIIEHRLEEHHGNMTRVIQGITAIAEGASPE